jgi:hypothetical protein
LFAFLGLPWDPDALADAGRPSALARREGTVGMGRSPLDAWKANLSEEQLRRGLDLLAEFGLDRIYGRDPMPLVSAGAQALIGGSRP